MVTAGEGIRGRSEKAENEGYYLKSYGLQALAIETAEGCAEWLHRRIREDWGFPDRPEVSMAERFTYLHRATAESVTASVIRRARIWRIKQRFGSY